MTDYDPESVPIRTAATVMLIDDRPDLQVFMMERNAKTVFAGGMWVFPGGSVDITDHPQDFESISVHRTDLEASELMQLPRGGLAFYVAAIREAFEEAGILLALNRAGQTPLQLVETDEKARFNRHRDRVNADSQQFLTMIDEEKLILDVGQMHYIARWITPQGPPRRFDARFFISRMPTNQEPQQDDNELVHCAWFSPEEILEKFDAGEMVLMSPTLRMIRCLAKFKSTEQVVQSAASNLADERARVNHNGELVLPGDQGYDDGDETAENGWVRLRPIKVAE